MAVVTKKKPLEDQTTDELKGLLATRRFLRSYFKTGRDPAFWDRKLLEVEEELRKRGALD